VCVRERDRESDESERARESARASERASEREQVKRGGGGGESLLGERRPYILIYTVNTAGRVKTGPC
jgi:hypothetical protein